MRQPYCLDCGEKYCPRFSEVLYAQLSAEGQAWLVRTCSKLELELEKELLADPWAYDDLQQDNAAFRSLAFGTQERACLDAGLASLRGPPAESSI